MKQCSRLPPRVLSTVRTVGLILGSFLVGKCLGVLLGAKSCRPYTIADLYDVSGKCAANPVGC